MVYFIRKRSHQCMGMIVRVCVRERERERERESERERERVTYLCDLQLLIDISESGIFVFNDGIYEAWINLKQPINRVILLISYYNMATFSD